MADIKARNTELEQQLVRERVARKYSLPDDLAARLRGATAQELEADAKALQKYTVAPEPVVLSGGLNPGDDSDTETAPARWPAATATDAANPTPHVAALARHPGAGLCHSWRHIPWHSTRSSNRRSWSLPRSACLRGALTEARRVLNKFNVPDGSRYLLVGSDFESALLNDDKLNLAQFVGDSEAESALTTATIGNRRGFRIVVSQEIPADTAFAFATSAFIFLSGARSVPQSVPYGATTSFEGIALRWVRDYDPTYMWDRSVVNTYAGFRSVTDVLVGWDETKQSEVVSTGEHFVRGIKLSLDGPSVYPPADGELATITGVSDAAPWPRPAIAETTGQARARRAAS